MPSSAGDEGGAVLPQAKKRCPNAVARAAGFRRRRKKDRKITRHGFVALLITLRAIRAAPLACAGSGTPGIFEMASSDPQWSPRSGI
jgi:hypothetical protein